MRFTESVCNSWLCNLSLNVCPVDDMSDCLNRVDASRAVTVGGRVPKPKIAYVHPRGAEALNSARSVPRTRVRLSPSGEQ